MNKLRVFNAQHGFKDVRLNYNPEQPPGGRDDRPGNGGREGVTVRGALDFRRKLLHPSIFESQAEIEALRATAMHEIETPVLCTGLPKGSQCIFLYDEVVIDGGEKVGFSQTQAVPKKNFLAAKSSIHRRSSP